MNKISKYLGGVGKVGVVGTRVVGKIIKYGYKASISNTAKTIIKSWSLIANGVFTLV